MPVYSLMPTPSELSRREELSRKTEPYQGTRAARRRIQAELDELGQRRNPPLPPELMGIIFDFYVHLYNQLPERLLLVCRAWHVLALSQPTLWTNLDPLGPFGLNVIPRWAGTFLQSRIVRSNPAPLKVDICSRNIALKDLQKIVDISDFCSRIQDLTITYKKDLVYVISDQLLLKRFIEEFRALDPPSANIAKCTPSEKTVTTLRLRCTESVALPIWPESLLRRLQTLEVMLTGDLEALHGFLSIVQKSTALLTLHIIMRLKCTSSSLSHASCRNLTITYYDDRCSWEGIRMPLLQELTIVTYTTNGLLWLTFIDTSISSLQLICKFGTSCEDMNQAAWVSWVDDAIDLLRSAPRLKQFSISAPFGLIASLSEAFAEDPNLCMELNTFIIEGPTEIDAKGRIPKKVEAKFDQLRSNVAASIDQRRLRQSKN